LENIFVTKSFLPPIEEYNKFTKRIWDSGILTNNGPLVEELEAKLRSHINNPYLSYVGNGTIAIQIAIKALDLSGSIITTPFSYCATTTSILWENLQPIFVDVNVSDLNINADLIEASIRPDTTAILATHVYGNPCDVEKIEQIAKKHKLKVIYDAAHAFGVEYKGKSLLNYGDVSTCSFHSTKVFHTIEGGSIVCHSEEMHHKMRLYRSFGHIKDEYFSVGINGKSSEFHAAMGLVNLPYLPSIIAGREKVVRQYDTNLNFETLQKPTEIATDTKCNFAYYPVVLPTAELTNKVIAALNKEQIYPRRYFYPSLNTLSYLKNPESCPISEDVSLRVLSLPLYPELATSDVTRIIEIINNELK
jgi:dTDP-4-amino-4,6-dideoxygalactose transaminase